MTRGGGSQQTLQDPVPLPSIFNVNEYLTSLSDVDDDTEGVYVCVHCFLELASDDDDTDRVLFFDDKPSARTHSQRTGHKWGWYRETVYKPFRDGFIHPGIVAAAQRLRIDATTDAIKLINGTRDHKRDHR